MPNKEAVQQILREFEEHYEKTGEPNWCWQAWSYARHHQVAPPPWVLNYFDRAAGAIYEMVRRPPKALAPALAAALGFTCGAGRGSAVSRVRHALDRERLFAAVVVALSVDDTVSTSGAVAAVAREHGVQDEAVYRALRELVEHDHDNLADALRTPTAVLAAAEILPAALKDERFGIAVTAALVARNMTGR